MRASYLRGSEAVSCVPSACESVKIISCVASSYGWFKFAASQMPNTLPMGLSSKENIYSSYISSDAEWTGVSSCLIKYTTLSFPYIVQKMKHLES